jgi:hypothetical protein
MATITPYTEAVTLTPVRVKKIRPSLSPVKPAKESEPKARALSEVLEKKPRVSPSATYGNGTAALNFEEFSFWGEDGSVRLRNLSDEQRNALLNYLGSHYGVTAMTVSLPFLILECEPDIPPEDQRPFSVAGAISVWVKPGEFRGFEAAMIGESGNGDRLTISENLANDLQTRKMPREDTLLKLVPTHFKDAIAISFIWDAVVVELPRMDWNLFMSRLGELPECFSNANVSLRFHNGSLPYTEQMQVIKPDATYLEGPKAVVDNTDYVKHQGCFYPGSMVHAVGEAGDNIGSVTAGILVEKGSARRLTVSYHCWEPVIEEDSSYFGSSDSTFGKVMQGEPGTQVGFVRERVGNTNIALAQLLTTVEFQNEFMEMQAQAKKLLPASEIEIGDEFLIDSFVTGRQRLRSLGVRFPLARKENARGHPKLVGPEDMLPLDECIYIELRQGVYASNEEKIPGRPKVRAGICGAVLIRCSLANDKARPMDSVLRDREVAGLMHFADLRSKSNTDTLLCYADLFDDLAKAGRKVAQMAEKESEPGNVET